MEKTHGATAQGANDTMTSIEKNPRDWANAATSFDWCGNNKSFWRTK